MKRIAAIALASVTLIANGQQSGQIITETRDVLTDYKPSFDCSKAGNFAERRICDNQRLGQLDGLLSATYSSRMSPPFSVDKKLMREDQKKWLKRRNSCTTDACLSATQKDRIVELCNIPVVTGVKPQSDCDDIDG